MKRFLMITLVAGCSGGLGLFDPMQPGTGRVESSLTSSTHGPVVVTTAGPGGEKGKVNEIIVTIEKVTAHSTSAGWVVLSSAETRVDILKLAQFAEPLGFKNMPAGKITQLRLYVKEGGEQFVTRTDGVRIDLKVPSGIESGIKIKGMFDVTACDLTSLTLELDGKKSIWVHPTGPGDLWILRPVVRLGHVDATSVGCMPTDHPGGAGGGNTTGGAGGGFTTGGAGGGDGNGGTGGGLTGSTGGGLGEGGGPTGSTGGGTGTGGDPTGSGGTPGSIPVLVPAGGTCTTGGMCLSGFCTGGVCGRGGADAPCRAPTDCVSGVCTGGACGVGGAGGTGTVCTSGTMCMSGACVAGLCEGGGQGKPCVAQADCALGYECRSGSCEPGIN